MHVEKTARSTAVPYEKCYRSCGCIALWFIEAPVACINIFHYIRLWYNVMQSQSQASLNSFKTKSVVINIERVNIVKGAKSQKCLQMKGRKSLREEKTPQVVTKGKINGCRFITIIASFV